MSRVLYAAGLGYVAICGIVLLSGRRAEPFVALAPYAGAAGQWFADTKPFCNALEVDVRQQRMPAPEGAEGAGYSAACYALAGKIDLARQAIDRLSGSERSIAAGIVFQIGHPVADAGDDRSASPIMRLVVEYQPDNYMALYHAGASEYILGERDYARTHLRRFLELYQPNDGWRSGALDMLERLRVTEHAYLAPGTVLRDRYEIRRELGRGGYSVVYLALDRELRCDVAVKLLVPPPAVAHVARERMRREVQVVRSLSHANIVAVFDFLEEGPWSFIVMEYVAGPDLSVRVRERGPLDAEQAAKLGADIAAALAAAHRRGILHRDVKPQNVLLDPDGRARLTDFGSAQLDGQLGVTATDAIAGTLSYTAPELLAGRRADARSDVYALGLTLYYALTGELPGRPSAHLPPLPVEGGYHPRDVTAGVPDWLDNAIARATAPPPEHRWPTAESFAGALAGSAAALVPVRAERGRCPLCGAPEPLGLGLCAACGGSGRAGDTLIYLDREMGGAERDRASATLIELLGGGISEGARHAAARGERPLLRVPAASVPRVLERLGGRALPAYPLRVAAAWRAVPLSLYVLVVAVLVAGFMAGVAAVPALLWTSPLVAALLLAACAAAGDLALLAENLTRFERGRERLVTLPEGWLDALGECERMRDGLVQRLLAALAVVGELVRYRTLGQVGAGAERLEDVTRELGAEARLQREALEEVERLLRSPAGSHA